MQSSTRAEIVPFLRQSSLRPDLVVIADTLVYLVSQSHFFAALVAVLTANSVVLLTTERCTIEGYQLRHTGRYAHSLSYLQRCAQQVGLCITRTTAVQLRKGGGGWVEGLYAELKLSTD